GERAPDAEQLERILLRILAEHTGGDDDDSGADDLGDAPELVPDDETACEPSPAVLLVALASAAEVFHTPAGEPYATVPVDDHRETYALRSSRFRDWLMRAFYRR